MATETVTRILDDLDGGTAERTVRFGWDGQTFEIDLSTKNLANLEKALKPYVDSARKVRGGRPARPARSASGRSGRRSSGARKANKVQDIREWARTNNLEISARGRIPATVIEAYNAAH